MDKRAAAQYLVKMFGNRVGHVAVAYKDKGQSWQECQFEWPKDRTKLLGWAEIHADANIFICPALRQDAHTRKKGDMQPSKWLWADVDWHAIPENKRAEVKARIADIGTYVVASGSGDNAHVYVQLSAPVSHEDFIKLNTGLRDYLYADNKQADNSLLRLPGTTNWKTDEGSPVKDQGGNGKPTTKANLMRRRAFRDAKVIADAEATEWSFVEVEGLPRRIKAMISMDVDEARARFGSRYKAVWGTTAELHKRGLTADEIHSLMDKFPPALSKAADENGYDVHEDVDKRLAWDRAKAPALEDDEEVDVDAGDMFEEMSAEEVMAALVDEGVQKELLRRSIRRAADMAEAAAGHTEPPPDTSQCLSDALEMPPAPVQYLIDGLVSATGTVVITGQYKSGKTHLMVASLLTSLADDEPFLGARAVHVPAGGAVCGHWNLEMSALDLIDKYMRPAQYKNPENVHVANWQGYRLNILTVPGKAAAVEWLKSRRVNVWTIDSWSALCRMCGVDPNDNKEVGDLLGAITEIKVEANVQVVFLLAHTARSSAENEKPGTRGASALDEGVDTRWMFIPNKEGIRWLSAEGRGTQMTGVSLDFDETTGRSTIGSLTRQSAAQDGMVQLIVRTLKDYPQGLNQATLVKLVKEVNKKGVNSIRDSIKDAEDGGWIKLLSVPRASGNGRPEIMHFLAGDCPPEGNHRMNATPREVNLSGVTIRRDRK